MSQCEFPHDAAAYVLGALDPADRQRFEAHLATCPACAATVREFGELPGVLAHAPIEDLDSRPPPRDLLPNLVVAARRVRRRRFLRTVLVTAAAVALFVVGAFAAVDVLAPQQPTPSLDVSLEPLEAVPITSSAGMIAQNEGTRIELSCDETGKGDKGGGYKAAYRLVVTNVKGDTDVAGSWTGADDGSTRVVLFTRWPPDKIVALEIQTMAKHPVLRWERA